MNFKITSINFNIPKISFRSTSSATPQPIGNKLENDRFEMSVGYVNDIHGQTNNMIRILSGIDGDIRLSAGDNDIGDEKNSNIHQATVKFLNMAKIKASALGNHEIDTTQEDCINSIKNLDGDMLCINYSKTPLEEQDKEEIKALGRAELDKYLKKSSVVEVKGEKIGLIGASPMDMFERLTHPNYYTDSHIDSLDETIEEIQDEIDNMKEQGINKIFLLSHLGHTRDQIVAQKTDGIDVIIGGHSHELIKDINENENFFYSKSNEPVVITEAGRDGNYFGKLNLEFDRDGVLTKIQNNLAETRLFNKNLITQYIFDKILGEPEIIGFVKDAPPPPKSLAVENPHANFVCDIMKEQTDSDIALWHNSGVRNFFHKGSLDSSDVKDMSPFLDYVTTANVSEKKIVDLFKHAIDITYKSPDLKPGLFAVSGLNYTVNPKKRTLVSMNFIDKDGKEHPIDIENPREDKFYKVVTDEFLMSAGADFDILCPEKDCIEKFNYDKDYLVCEYLKATESPIIINHTGRIKFEHND